MEGDASLGPFPGVAAKIVQFFAVGVKLAARLGVAACARSENIRHRSGRDRVLRGVGRANEWQDLVARLLAGGEGSQSAANRKGT
ncbi:hypothetical protein ACVWWO_003599 [Bradyrhizobium sp. F1.13.1]